MKFLCTSRFYEFAFFDIFGALVLLYLLVIPYVSEGVYLRPFCYFLDTWMP